MRCHYEVLELTREADDGEIKTAYRKLALKWHPDKNLDDPVLAKEQFQIVQQAYEVLSDKQERAWYDAHRDQILRGSSSEFQDKSLDVFQYFSTTCFKGYSDDDGSFYNVYRKVFDQIAKEDIEFMDEKEEFCEIPDFGRSQSDNDTVKAFYDYWMSYSTKKSYSWLDPYDIREGKGDRRLLKIIEKENKKARLKARKERNEEVRNLVAFVRKRDRRVQFFKKEMEAKTLENRKKQEQLSKQKRLERKQMHSTEKQADWSKFDNVQSELEEIEKHLAQEFGEELSQSDEEEEEEDFNNLYCVACNKIFKNPNAFENHEISKKHRENVEKLKETMLEEDSNMTDDDSDECHDLEDEDEDDLEDIIDENEGVSGEESIPDEEDLPEIIETTKKKKRKGRNKSALHLEENVDQPEDNEEVEELSDEGDNSKIINSEDEDGALAEDLNKSAKKSKKKNKKAKNVLNGSQNGFSDHFSIVKEDSDDEFDFGLSKSQKKKNKKNISNNKWKSSAGKTEKQADGENAEASSMEKETTDDPSPIDKATSKKQARKEKKANKKDVEPIDASEIDVNHCCVTCKNNFNSKNKLFEHLKKTGHGVLIPSKTLKQSSKRNTVKN